MCPRENEIGLAHVSLEPAVERAVVEGEAPSTTSFW
jgi:hypothetical protein